MECLTTQFASSCPCTKGPGACTCEGIGDVGTVSIDIAQEIKSFIAANPIPSVGIGLAVGYLLYTLLKSK